ncbi:conserved hypothetical protein [Bradyrhizobium sp. STM 3843]|uniref:hypothetical protein n=1 Tax=Bradyrhizobium sp. STM 3843 TaxID=551947 RepID=UPI0002404021|nr:hypothetical protein [Bradyrhizobium sp. STM 3843]CCE09166.1 conserved hypothetical protein [Bradyrhizobium sp. STM 3843]
MSERSISINLGKAAFHPVSHYASPAAVLGDDRLSAAEKRLILSSWASDMYAIEDQPAWRNIPGVHQPLRLADILGALRQLDHEDQPPRPRGGAAMRVPSLINVDARAGSPDGEGRMPTHGLRGRTIRLSSRARFSREANVRRYRSLLATKLADHERRFVERRLAEELQS